MALLLQLLLLIHVFAAMYWFGASAGVPRRVREALAGDVHRARAAFASLARDAKLFMAAGVLVFLTGLGMALIRGFAMLPPRLHAGLGLTVIWLGIGLGVLRPTMQKIGAAVATSDSIPDTTVPLRKRVAMWMGIQHLLFTVITVLMLWRI
ncbi:MAG: DUF2269 family protein [Myxococcales bacterium]|nr:DUF2269 family protein [Myxococcales bacterium]MDD9965870.1 DUF2269 family protein [Myxococcales bacterium]